MVHAPWGAHPSNVPGRYYIDEEIMREWAEQSKTVGGTELFLKKYVFDVQDFEGYLKAIGGTEKLKHLEGLERMPMK